MVKFYLSPRPDKKGECPIRVSISLRGIRLISTAGFNISPDKWHAQEQRAKKGAYNESRIPASTINARLKAIDSFFSNFAIGLDHQPTTDELAKHLAVIKGNTRRREKRDALAVTALEYFDRFLIDEGKNSQWSAGTLTNWRTFRGYLQGYKEELRLSDFNENGLERFLNYLRTNIGLGEASTQQMYKLLRWFLNWCIRKKYTTNVDITRFKPKFKTTQKPIIFLDKEELLRLYHYEIPASGTIVKLTDNKGKEYEKEIINSIGLDKSRDFFCFCAFTSLRYSDALALKRSNIMENSIRFVTKKTTDALDIELNNYSRAILDKYKNEPTPLPRVNLHLLNESIKTLGELCGFNELISRVVYKQGKRIEITQRKWECLSSHAGRRTFICYALSIGISPQMVMRWSGHSDYEAMKPYISIADDAKHKAMADFNDTMEEAI